MTTLKTTSLPRFLSNVFINLLVKINFHVVCLGGKIVRNRNTVVKRPDRNRFFRKASEKGHLALIYYFKSSLAGYQVPEIRRHPPDAPMDFDGLAELKVFAFASSKVVQCKERPREERR